MSQIIINNLIYSTNYEIVFTLDYLDLNKTIISNKLEVLTNNKCNCKINKTSVIGYYDDENCEIKNKCKCKDCYEGINCNQCKSNCYLNNKTLECVKCPCDLNKSDGSCLFDEDYDGIICSSCVLPNIGLYCDECDVYYYKTESNDCLPCMCNSNTNPMARHHCGDINGNYYFD